MRHVLGAHGLLRGMGVAPFWYLLSLTVPAIPVIWINLRMAS